mmetsp:Transcript_31382/g.80082  ORF Transcript_31382/g.80082 Transcript_31382/m.80082 type:complete len:333 (+) Transcript_31382:2146-3144(+)
MNQQHAQHAQALPAPHAKEKTLHQKKRKHCHRMEYATKQLTAHRRAPGPELTRAATTRLGAVHRTLHSQTSVQRAARPGWQPEQPPSDPSAVGSCAASDSGSSTALVQAVSPHSSTTPYFGGHSGCVTRLAAHAGGGQPSASLSTSLMVPVVLQLLLRKLDSDAALAWQGVAVMSFSGLGGCWLSSSSSARVLRHWASRWSVAVVALLLLLLARSGMLRGAGGIGTGCDWLPSLLLLPALLLLAAAAAPTGCAPRLRSPPLLPCSGSTLLAVVLAVLRLLARTLLPLPVLASWLALDTCPSSSSLMLPSPLLLLLDTSASSAASAMWRMCAA